MLKVLNKLQPVSLHLLSGTNTDRYIQPHKPAKDPTNIVSSALSSVLLNPLHHVLMGGSLGFEVVEPTATQPFAT